MRKYIVDKLLVLTVIIGIMIVLPFASRSVTIIIVEIGLAIGYGYMCWRVLVFSLDLLRGSRAQEMQTVYFVGVVLIEKYHILRQKYCIEWKFRYPNNKTITLLVPVSVPEEELDTIESPIPNAPVKITYYRFSKILINWEPI